MRIARPKTDAGQRRHRANGFSLLEMIVVIALLLIVGKITFVSLIPVLKQQRVTNAYDTTLAAMRQARDNAVAQRTSYSVTFSNSASPNTIVVAPTVAGFQGDQNTATYQLPVDVTFVALNGIPITTATTPDGYGTGSNAIDFGYAMNGTGSGGGQSTIYFCPDGSSQNTSGAGSCLGAGNWSGGVIYIARQGELLSSRAITLWGGTGRVRGWRLYPNTSGGYQWLRQ
jgi:prepilin-type N-terminal cleavage/methylation domain-containing protein